MNNEFEIETDLELLRKERDQLYDRAGEEQDDEQSDKTFEKIEAVEKRIEQLQRSSEAEVLFEKDAAAFAELLRKTGKRRQAEIEDETRLALEQERKREAQLERNPKLAFDGIFEGQHWTGYANFPLALLGLIPFEDVPSDPLEEKERREQRRENKERLCRFVRDYVLMYVARTLYQNEKEDMMKLPQLSRLFPSMIADEQGREDNARVSLGNLLERSLPFLEYNRTLLPSLIAIPR
jgi:hypothetical protein